MSFWEPTPIEEVKAKAEAQNCDFVQANDFRLLLDLDNGDAHFNFAIDMLQTVVEHETPESWKSTGGNLHVSIKLLKPLPAVTRYGLQACLGSDLLRELQNYRDLSVGILEPCVLFRPREVAGGL